MPSRVIGSFEFIMSPGLLALIIVVIIVVGWFAVGTQYNVRKGDAAMRWLQDGLPLIGEKTTVRWLGSSVLQLTIPLPKPPFQKAEVLVVLEPRDVAPLWALARLRGRRDLFIFRGTLCRPPRLEIEARDSGAWSPDGFTANHRWAALPTSPPLVAYTTSDLSAASQLLQSAAIDDCPLQRLAVRQTMPQLEVQWHFERLRRQPARTVFETVQRIARLL